LLLSQSLPSSPSFAGVPEYGLAIFLDVVIEPDAMTCPRHDVRQGRLTDFERLTPQIVAPRRRAA
jgi:hypothetical protein